MPTIDIWKVSWKQKKTIQELFVDSPLTTFPVDIWAMKFTLSIQALEEC